MGVRPAGSSESVSPFAINRKHRGKAEDIERYPIDKLADISYRLMVFKNLSYKKFLKSLIYSPAQPHN